VTAPDRNRGRRVLRVRARGWRADGRGVAATLSGTTEVRSVRPPGGAPEEGELVASIRRNRWSSGTTSPAGGGHDRTSGRVRHRERAS
jgi:hypothetical protein